MQVLVIGNRSRFKKEILDIRDSIVLLYNDNIYMEKGKDYTEGYLKGLDSIIELIAKYEQKEIDKVN